MGDTYPSGGSPSMLVNDKRKAPFWWADNKVLLHFSSKRLIDSESFLVYCCLCTFAGESRTCFPSVKAISQRSGLALNTVRDRIYRLHQVGLIELVQRKDEAGDATSHLYILADLSHIQEDEGYSTPRGTPRGEVPHTVGDGTPHRGVRVPHGVEGNKTQYEQDSVNEKAASPARAREDETATPEERAIALYREPEANNHVYSFLGAGLYGRTLDEWTERIGDHFRNGREVTIEHLKQARLDAEAAFDAHGQGKRTMGWYYSALATILNPKVVQGGQAKGKPPARNSQYAGLTLDERVAATLAELENESGKP